MQKGGGMATQVCRECGRPMKPKYSLLEKLAKDLFSLAWLTVKSIVAVSFGIVTLFWFVTRPKIGHIFLRVGIKAIEIGIRLLNKRN